HHERNTSQHCQVTIHQPRITVRQQNTVRPPSITVHRPEITVHHDRNTSQHRQDTVHQPLNTVHHPPITTPHPGHSTPSVILRISFLLALSYNININNDARSYFMKKVFAVMMFVSLLLVGCSQSNDEQVELIISSAAS